MQKAIDPRLDAIIEEFGELDVLDAVAAVFDYQFNSESITRSPEDQQKIIAVLDAIRETISRAE